MFPLGIVKPLEESEMKEDKNIAVSIQNIQKLGDQLAEN
jgi:hypothetical protein